MSEMIPLGTWVDQSVHYLLDHDAKTFDAIGQAIEGLAAFVEHGLQAIPMWLMMAIFIGVGLWRVGWRFALFTTLSLLLIFATGFWDQTVITLGLTLSSTIISLVLGIPLGIWAAKSKWVAAIVRPILDLMQTMPAFVYLIPAAMLFGLGRVPGILSTVIFAMPPAVRLTSLGIRHVNREIVEAGQAFGCTPWQLLYKVQFPNARRRFRNPVMTFAHRRVRVPRMELERRVPFVDHGQCGLPAGTGRAPREHRVARIEFTDRKSVV